MTTYVVTAMVSFEDDSASADHIFNQINAVMVNASVSRIGEPGERTSYCSVGTENPDGSVTRTSHLYVDQFGIVRQGDPDLADPPNWIQPTGAQDAYPASDVRGNQTRVAHNGQIWLNTHGDANVWAPGAFGWVAE